MDGNPQVENGFTRVANELLEALCRCPMLNENTRVFLAIMRKTYGYGKKDDVIALSQIEELTGLPRRSVKRARRNLEQRNMILVSNLTPVTPLRIGINKTYNQWKVVSNLTLVSKSVTGGVKSAPITGVKSAPHNRKKDTITKENIAFADTVIEQININLKTLNPKSRGYQCTEENRKHILARMKKWSREDILKVVDNVKGNNFYKENPMHYNPETLMRPSKFERNLNFDPSKQQTPYTTTKPQIATDSDADEFKHLFQRS